MVLGVVSILINNSLGDEMAFDLIDFKRSHGLHILKRN